MWPHLERFDVRDGVSRALGPFFWGTGPWGDVVEVLRVLGLFRGSCSFWILGHTAVGGDGVRPSRGS